MVVGARAGAGTGAKCFTEPDHLLWYVGVVSLDRTRTGNIVWIGRVWGFSSEEQHVLR